MGTTSTMDEMDETRAWRQRIRELIQLREPPHIDDILASPKYGVVITSASAVAAAPLTHLDFGYIDSAKATHAISTTQMTPDDDIRGMDATESFSIWNGGAAPVSIAAIAPLSENHPFVFTTRGGKEKAHVEPHSSAPTTVEIGLKAVWPDGLPQGIFESRVAVFFQMPIHGPAFDFHMHIFCIVVRVRVARVRTADVRALAVDSPPFVPHALRSAFHAPKRAWGFPSNMHPHHSALSVLLDTSVPQFSPSGVATPPVDAMELMKLQSQLHLSNNYYRFHTALLRKEETRMAIDMFDYDLFHIRLVVHQLRSTTSPYVMASLQVPGAVEGRPVLLQGSVVRLRGDHVLLAPLEIHGLVVEVKESTVTLMLPCDTSTLAPQGGRVRRLDAVEKSPLPTFAPADVCQLYQSSSFHVRFSYPRDGLRMAYRALMHLKPAVLSILTPQSDVSPPYEPSLGILDYSTSSIEWINSVINDRQRLAVLHIVNRTSSSPHVIFGPPGTGKTITVIEAILQVLRHDVAASILAVAPSDAAADILGARLRESLDPSALLRLNWPHRKIASVPGILIGCCHVEAGKDVFSIPDADSLRSFRVIVTTCALAGVLEPAGVTPGHFTHLFVDEACQATEPETVVALSMCDANTHVTLAGDPMQLGPSCRAASSYQFRLVESFQERLMRLPMYECHDENATRITKLVNNYRSHVALISLSSTLFYNRELKACADPRLVDSMCQWEGLRGLDQFPLVFYSIHGVQQQMMDTAQSFYNPLEAIKVADVIEELLASKTANVSTQDIGVITPYRQQVIRIRLLLRARGFGAVNVGTVYNFQGQEAKITILSTVATTMTSTTKDYRRNDRLVPALSDFKSFNVAITRARALCIVVGHPNVLSRHPLWSYFMGYCAKHGGFRGDDEEDIVFSPHAPIVRMGHVPETAPEDPEWHTFM
ncbi:Aste57867_20290 [Aphanomyces stellatus]|uniref:Aste57867_20290 protein n=1 Tax=Aphanomyces stellatus TaxID=120398 RepID=A0A485LES7_9STRA|nr:hypothetical protein As57867_020224 [Aphanomyces stellatus]VFT96980.1 Aste57867_20290 [Aphanomyces stellatus]